MTPRVRERHKFMQWILAWNHGDPCALETLFVSFNSPINELTIWAHFQFMGKTSWIRKPRVQLLCCRPIWIGSCYVIHLHPSETSYMPFTCWSPCCLTLSVRLGCSRVHVRWVDAGAYELQYNNCLQFCLQSTITSQHRLDHSFADAVNTNAQSTTWTRHCTPFARQCNSKATHDTA